jgi:hypothetical protein
MYTHVSKCENDAVFKKVKIRPNLKKKKNLELLSRGHGSRGRMPA